MNGSPLTRLRHVPRTPAKVVDRVHAGIEEADLYGDFFLFAGICGGYAKVSQGHISALEHSPEAVLDPAPGDEVGGVWNGVALQLY